MLVRLSELDTEFVSHTCNTIDTRDRRRSRMFKVFCFHHHNPTISICHHLNVWVLGTVRTVLKKSVYPQFVSNIVFVSPVVSIFPPTGPGPLYLKTHIKAPTVFKTITPLPGGNQDEKIPLFSNICLLCQSIRRNIQVFRNLLVLWLWNMLNRTLKVREPGFIVADIIHGCLSRHHGISTIVSE